ncbi:hypothetical protein [Fulvitalea axinellae]
MAQEKRRDQPPGNDNERIQSVKIAFITDLLELSPTQAQQFWPLFNEYSAKYKALADQWMEVAKLVRKNPKLNEKESEKNLKRILELQEKQDSLKRQYLTEYEKFLSKNQVLKLALIESSFKRFLLKHMRRPQHGGGPEHRKHRKKMGSE